MLTNRGFFSKASNPKVSQICLAFIIGMLLGILVIVPPYLPIDSNFQNIILAIPFVLILVALFKRPDKLLLYSIPLTFPLNLDFSLIISSHARNALNIASGNHTIVALTELRLSLTLIIVLIGYVLWLVEPQEIGRKKLKFYSHTTIPALGLIIVSILSMSQAQDVQLSFFKVFQLIELFLIYFYLVNHLKTKQDFYLFLILLTFGMLAESILMVIQWQTGFSFSFAGISASVSHNRAAGTLGSADTAGSIMASYLLVVCSMATLFTKRYQKLLAGICFIFGCVALISTAGRAAWGGFLVMFLLFFTVGLGRGWLQRRSIVLLISIMIIVGVIFYPAISNRLTADDRGSAASRPKMFRLAWNVIESSPSHFFLGVGSNNYALIAHNYNSAEVGNLGYIIYSSVHNVILLNWAETGLFGLLIFLFFLINPLLFAWKLILSTDRYLSIISLGLGCALLVMFIQMQVDPFIARPKTLFVWLLITLITGLNNLIENKKLPISIKYNFGTGA